MTTWTDVNKSASGTPEVDFLFSDGLDFLFSDSLDFVFKEASPSGNWTEATKNSASWVGATKNSATWSSPAKA